MKKKVSYAPLKKKRLYEEVATQIKKTIFNGDLNPGDKLPSERELAEMFGVGRPTVREALRTLSVLGLIESNPGFKGSIVKKNDLNQYLEDMAEQFTWMIKADKKSVEEITGVMKYIDLGIAHATSQEADSSELRELDDYIQKMKAYQDNIGKYFKNAMDFHLKLAEFSRNKIFYIIYKLFHKFALENPPILSKVYHDKVPKLLECNRVMLEAIKSKNPDKIDKAMEAHAKEDLPFT